MLRQDGEDSLGGAEPLITSLWKRKRPELSQEDELIVSDVSRHLVPPKPWRRRKAPQERRREVVVLLYLKFLF